MTEAAKRLIMLEPRCSAEDALAFFDALPTLPADTIPGPMGRS
jgi:hypothetical protein